MDLSKTLYSLLGVLVSIIIIATVAMPAITSASTTTTTTTTTEIQDVEVSDPIYYKPYSGEIRVVSDGNTPSIQQYYGGWTGYTLDGDFTSIPLVVSDTAVCILYKDESGCHVLISGIKSDSVPISTKYTLDQNLYCTIVVTYAGINIGYKSGGVGGSTNYAAPTWNYVVSIPEYGGDYVASLSQETVTLGSLNEIVAGSARYVSQGSADFASIYNGEQTKYGDYALGVDSVQTDAGIDVSLKASYGDTEVLVLVPTTTEVNVTQTITVQTEYGPILNVVMLMLLIVPVTAVAAMLYTRRD